MKVPLKWLKEYCQVNVSAKELAEKMTMSGSKVETLIEQGAEIINVVTGKIVSLKKHPDAQKLQVADVDIGNKNIQIVTGATNIKEGDVIPVALDGARLPNNIKIKKTKLRGIESNGMMCSIGELGLDKEDYPEFDPDGIIILKNDVPIGVDIREVLGINDTIFEFEITSNRPDCLSVVGLAREAAVTMNVPFNMPKIKVEEEGGNITDYASVEVHDDKLCPRYAARVVTGVKIEESPEWLKNKLKAVGIRSINNIVDITNYVMVELGQPMHAFDLKNLEGQKIVVRRADEGEIIKTLDDQERKLDSSMLVIADAKKPVAVAGVMGGANSEVSLDTKTILLESANFDGVSVRLTAKKLGMRTESSARFEKGLDTENVITALNRAAELIEQLGAGKVCKGVIDFYPNPYCGSKLKLDPEKLNKFLGANIDTEYMFNLFEKLGFEVNRQDLVIVPPSFRRDVYCFADLAEEVARFYDYNNIKPTKLDGKSGTRGGKTYEQIIESRIVESMIADGLYEVCTYSFVSPKIFNKLNIPANSKLRNAIAISNPLGEDYSIMRTTTVASMLDVIHTNYSRKIEEAGFFEIGRVYIPKELPLKELPEEPKILTIGMYGKNTDFYSIKGVIEDLFKRLGIDNYEFSLNNEISYYHPGRCANITAMFNKKQILFGYLGEIHPEVVKNFDIPKRVYVAEIYVSELISSAILNKKYKQLPKYPAIERDLALIVDKGVTVLEIEKEIRKCAGKLLEESKLFDIYEGGQIPQGKKSLAFSISFRAQERTLKDEEVNAVIDKLLVSLDEKYGAKLRT